MMENQSMYYQSNLLLETPQDSNTGKRKTIFNIVNRIKISKLYKSCYCFDLLNKLSKSLILLRLDIVSRETILGIGIKQTL